MSPKIFLKIWEFYQKSAKIVKKNQFRHLEKGVIELFRGAMIKARQIERSVFFLLSHNGNTRVYRLGSGTTDVWL